MPGRFPSKDGPCPLSMPLHTGLHTWYVGARTAPAAIGGYTEPRVPPTCRRLPRDFALFPTAIGFHFHLTGVVHQTARSRPASLISLADDTLGETGSKNVQLDKRLQDDFAQAAKER